ncbi:MAG: 30S ribosomal protein S12 methylthiotransferase RimO [Myxococcota bacterium]|jgi:ribosomal protein S12 methylthiotransferase
MKKKIRNVCIISLGCPKNRVDSEVMAGLLSASGRKLVAEAADADAIIINTCSFIRDAKEESIDIVLEAASHKQDRGAAVIVTGCLPQRYRDEIEGLFPEVDAFLGTGTFQKITEVLDGLEAGALQRRANLGRKPHFLLDHRTPRMNSSAPWTAYVKIAEGCSNSCSFCAIPQIRGPQESRPIGDIAAEVESLAGSGVREFNLIAQDLTAYGTDLKSKVRLHDLLRELCTIGDVRWIRLLYCYPRTFPVELMKVIAREDKINKYVDMPLQHIDESILRSMKRGRGPGYVRGLIEKMRSEIPGLVLRTAFILGYPGESEQSYRDLCGFIEEMAFENAVFFAFSPEEGTTAALLPDQQSEGTKLRRLRRIHAIQRKVSRRLNSRYLGRRIEVLVHGASEASEHLMEGRHRGQAPEIDGVVYINDGVAAPGDIVTCEITQTADYDLVGHIVG